MSAARREAPAGSAPRPQPSTARPLPPDEFHRWYGGWDPLEPASVGEFMRGFDRPWWIIGGWAIEKHTGVHRAHEDMDISILSSDAEAFRQFVSDQWTPWNMDQGWLRPFDHRFRDISPLSSIWVRRNAQSSWVLDVPLTPEEDGRWTNKKRSGQSAPLDEVTWTADDGLRYLRPEIALFMKHQQSRDKDRLDASILIPRLDGHQRDWLRDSLSAVHPGHAWLERL
ncbi:nucleotidyltransferase domain-containing protein [Microbacterium sp. gxy059]|uniref:nucleotidyltransferase domain-containing protein n=1 Tax=Microbacterium sp. gxy059 TaxID=2957199 RepID=UPI003D973195